MIVKIFHRRSFSSLWTNERHATVEIAKHLVENRTVTRAEWQLLRESFSPKRKGEKVEATNIFFYAEGFGDVVAIDETGQGYFNGVGGIFDLTNLIKKAMQRKGNLLKVRYREPNELTRVTIKNGSRDRFVLQDQNGILQGDIPPQSVTKLETWSCKYMLSNLSTPATLYFRPSLYPKIKEFVLQGRKVRSQYVFSHQGDHYTHFLELQIR